MRIAITGTHGVGKSSLGRKAVKCWNDLFSTELIQGVARSIILEGFPLNMDAVDESYIQYIVKQIKAERMSKKNDIVISDRTLLDPLAYALVNEEIGKSTVKQSTIELLKELWYIEQQMYAFYVYVPIEFPMEEDGIRLNNEEYRVAVDRKIQSLLNSNGIDYITVTGTVDDRFLQLNEAFNMHKTQCMKGYRQKSELI